MFIKYMTLLSTRVPCVSLQMATGSSSERRYCFPLVEKALVVSPIRENMADPFVPWSMWALAPLSPCPFEPGPVWAVVCLPPGWFGPGVPFAYITPRDKKMFLYNYLEMNGERRNPAKIIWKRPGAKGETPPKLSGSWRGRKAKHPYK